MCVTILLFMNSTEFYHVTYLLNARNNIVYKTRKGGTTI